MTPRALIATAFAVLPHPTLWPTALVQVMRMAPSGWWHRPPFLPLPDVDLLRFRLQTQYGDPEHVPDPDDVLTWLQWCRRWG
ncbi:MAG: hypothetical protein ACT4PW_10495 [Acidimicrobiia bacterium]